MSQSGPGIWDSAYGAPRQPAFVPSIYGPLELVSGSPGLPLDVAEVKQHCRVETDQTFDDGYFADMIESAAKLCEQEVGGHRQFLAATYNLPLLGWWEGSVKLHRPPLFSLNGLYYFDTGGTEQLLASTTYIVRVPWRQPGTVERAPFTYFPAYQGDRRLSVRVNYTAGYTAPVIAWTRRRTRSR